jgi:hypothetical protein
MPQTGEHVSAWLNASDGLCFCYGRSVHPLWNSLEGEPVPPGTRLYVVLKWDDLSELKSKIDPDERLRDDWVEPDSEYAPTRSGTIVGATRTWLQSHKVMNALEVIAEKQELKEREESLEQFRSRAEELLRTPAPSLSSDDPAFAHSLLSE